MKYIGLVLLLFLVGCAKYGQENYQRWNNETHLENQKEFGKYHRWYNEEDQEATKEKP